MPEAAPLEVAVAVIQAGGKCLIAQRKAGDSFGGYWEFPGGKIQPGETLEEGLVREIREELAVQIEVGSLLRRVEHRYPQQTIRLHCFICRILSGEPQAMECAAWRWVSASELKQFSFPPASGPLIEALLRL